MVERNLKRKMQIVKKNCLNVSVPMNSTRMLNNFKTLTIIHTNDVHGSVLEEKTGEIGFPKVSTFVKKNRDEKDNVVLLDAGDVFHGKVYTNLTKGKIILDIMNSLNYDALVPGNHDFNYGQDRLIELKDKAKFDVIAANVKDIESKQPFLSYIIKKLNGIKVGIFGLATPETEYKTCKKNIEGLRFIDPVKVAREMVKKLKGKVDVIIALSHLGEVGKYNSHDFAKLVPGIDLIIDGHSHDFLKDGRKVKDILIAQTGASLKAVGYVTLKVLNNQVVYKKAELLYQKDLNKLEEDKKVKKIIDKALEKERHSLGEKIGHTDVNLNGEREFARTSNTNLGVLIAKAMLERSGAEIAFLNGGGMRTSIPKGDITVEKVINVLPFGNTLVEKEIKGEDIKKIMEIAVGEYPIQMGGFPQIAGMKIKFDAKKEKGNKICEIKVNGKDLDPNRKYKMVMTNTTAEGGDDIYILSKYPLVNEYESCDEILINYLRKHDVSSIDLSSNVIVK